MSRSYDRFWYTLVAVSAMLLSFPEPARAQTQPSGLMLRFPDVSKDSIVFSYANDLWTVPRTGGLARPLASPQGREEMPRFSQDGSQIAFTGNYDGGTDLYVIPAQGGMARRVTYHPAAEVLQDWTPAGDLMFSARGYQGNARPSRLFQVSPEGGLPTPLPVPYGNQGAISGDGEWLAYTPWSRDRQTWKRYRGGMASDLWLMNLKTQEARQATDWEGSDTHPLWHEGVLYFVSDAGPAHRMNLWSMNPDTGDREQITHFEDFDVQWPEMGPGPDGGGEIVFQAGSGLHLLDLDSGKITAVDVQIPGDRPTIRPRRVDVGDSITAIDLSPTGQRMVVEARGDVWTLPAQSGPPRNLTRSSGAADRDPTWSPDGKWIAWFSDQSGEYELWMQQSDGKEPARQITTNGGVFKHALGWSPDSMAFAFGDMSGTSFVLDLEDDSITTIDQDPIAELSSASFSGDGRYLAYTRHENDNMQQSVWVYDRQTDERHRVTSGMFNDTEVVFDRDGDYLYFTSNRYFDPTYSNVDDTFIYDEGTKIYMIPLHDAVERPWAPVIDEESWTSEDEDEALPTPEGRWVGDHPADGVSGELVLEATDEAGVYSGVYSANDSDDSEADERKTVESSIRAEFDAESGDVDLFDSAGDLVMTLILSDGLLLERDEEIEDGWAFESMPEPSPISFEGIEVRAMALPLTPGSYSGLAVAADGRLLFVDDSVGGVHALDTLDPEAEPTFLVDADFLVLSADGESMLIGSESGFAIAPIMEDAEPEPISTDGMIAQIDPRAEWEQMFNDSWRIFRDYFYLENMHGLDWEAVREHYRPMVDDCVTREDLNHVIGEMIAELNVGHAYRYGGDLESASHEPVGMLGVDFEQGEGGWKIGRIHQGADWDIDARGPLSLPGVDVAEGDYLLAVNGVPVDSTQDPHLALIGTAGMATTLTVGPTATMDDDARDVVVTPLRSDERLRYRSWVEGNRRTVEAATDGRVGYVYVPDTGVRGQNELFRQFFGQTGTDALIIDERFNAGGQIPWRFIELLNRPVSNHWAVRHGRDLTWPYAAHHGPKCMIINGMAGSGGDMFPWLFRQSDLGPLIGERTWGGLVGISGNPELIDGGGIAVPTFGFYETDGTWGVEGHGVDPDIQVIADPQIMMSGTDPQLDRAIREMLASLELNPPRTPIRPASPDRRGMGLPKEDY